MHKFWHKWNTLPVHKQAAAILVSLFLAYSLYASLVTVLVIPVVNYLQQDARHDSHHN